MSLKLGTGGALWDTLLSQEGALRLEIANSKTKNIYIHIQSQALTFMG